MSSMAGICVELELNGQVTRLEGPPSMPLLYALRDQGCKSVRLGCGAGECGACHVLIEGRSRPACDTPLESVAGQKVLTVEGMSRGGVPTALQQAFIDEQAAQCGYCLSGILITATELLSRNPHPSAAEVRQALDGHLCRCGAHVRIVRAVLRAAAVATTESA